jgi:hypothetical protein
VRVIRRVLVAFGSLVAAWLAVSITVFPVLALLGGGGAPAPWTNSIVMSFVTVAVIVLGGLIYRDIMRREQPATAERPA